MQIVNEEVHHRHFGTGKVIEQTDSLFMVQFEGQSECKKFIFPFAFEHFLKLCDPVAQKQVEDQIQQQNEQAQAELKQREEELKQRLEEERLARKATTRKSTAVKLGSASK